MIQITSTQSSLYAAIKAKNGTWFDRAKKRTSHYRALRSYGGGSEFWGDIKEVYIDLQHEKCAYCEMKLAGKKLASKVHEVEHFRPKSRVSKWPVKAAKGLVQFSPPCKVGNANASGYYLLSYHPLNYLIACTRCNSTLKSDYFPIRGRRNVRGGDPTKLSTEDALLLYPLGTIDVDPSTLIRFDGVLAVPARKKGKNYERALVNIEFFKLNHEDLTTRRAQIVALLWDALRTIEVPSLPKDLRNAHQLRIDLATDSRSEFSACARDFVELYGRDSALAGQYGALAQNLIGR
ncbi:hypothetical protein [Stenotrophomonas maltophilia]|uniref:hypothetical protein n=1 Tax=Stenotrophomonas maltophilia TaxID=40324 RepID=UPI0039F688E8